MSPGQARGETFDARTDLFSLGLVLSEMLAGKPALTRPRPRCSSTRCSTGPRHLYGRWIRDVPKAVDAVVTHLLAKSPADRYQTATALLADLTDLLRRVVLARRPRQAPIGAPARHSGFGCSLAGPPLVGPPHAADRSRAWCRVTVKSWICQFCRSIVTSGARSRTVRTGASTFNQVLTAVRRRDWPESGTRRMRRGYGNAALAPVANNCSQRRPSEKSMAVSY
jgi:serine/threonine protein kinase